ncbi:P83/100 family protein [Oceanispirochaeta sp.]|uniref:P83/100 family protein n=1 Tax=Oceanispirochaeta sp. TaxID=2035350 RepID=UPI00261BCAA5|nr:P83/100 family protein [Oceanispirochaeta sp.]MDA3956533.1 P83/100 family protein [Oceanispirochaeta sp.]
MKKTALFINFILISMTVAYAQTVSEEELRSIGNKSGEIIFENYVGPVTEFSTREEIRGIGSFLATSDGNEVSWSNKSRIIRSYQPEIPEGLDADILVILPDAGVDHIRNLRFILSAYLQNTFDYSLSNADVLAEFVTYYNAVYYKNLEHFSSRYKPGVLLNINAGNAGLSTHYSVWAGKSRIIIPLKSGDATLQSSLDTSLISTPEVIEEMQKEDDKALDSRREMVEIREEDLDKRQEVLDEEKKAVVEKEKEVTLEFETKKEELKKAEPESIQEKVLQQEVEQLEEKKKAVEEEKKTVQEQEKEIKKEQQEVVEMREEIASDENLLLKEETRATGTVLSSEAIPEPEGFWFILVDKSGDPASFGSLWKVTKDGVPLKQSELNSIRGTNYKDSSEGIIVIAGKNDDRTRVKALLLDHGTLEILKEGETEIYPGSSIWTQGNNLFMISRNGQNWSVGMYSQSLKLLQLSSLNVHPDTGLVFIEDRVLVQSVSGGVKALSVSSLKEIEITE